METRTYYTVETGWTWRVHVGDNYEERRGDSPSCEWFDTIEEAREAYGREDIAQTWNTEKTTAGRAWRHKAAYKQLSVDVFEVDEDGGEDIVSSEIVAIETYEG